MKTKEPNVSVILPVYNGAHVVSRAVKSIISQTFEDWELIAVDDHSTDHSFSILESLQETDDRIRVYRNPRNLGLTATLNKAIKLALGEYIAVQEQDDISTPKRLLRQVEILDTHPDIALVSGVAQWLSDEMQHLRYFPDILAQGKQYPQTSQEMFEYLYIEQSKIVHAGCMYRGSVLREYEKPYNEAARMSGDWELFLDLARRHRIWGLHQVVVQMSRGDKRKSLTTKKTLQFSEARRCIQAVYHKYKHEPAPKVTLNLWRKSMTTQLLLEARHYGRLKAVICLLQAVILNPENRQVWKTIRWLLNNMTSRLLNLAIRRKLQQINTFH